MDSRTTSFLLALPAAMAFALSGCDRPTPLGLSENPSLLHGGILTVHADPGRAVPFQFRARAVLLDQVFAPDFGPPIFGESLFDGRCTVSSDFTLAFGLEGEATHLGRFTGTAEHCSQVDFSSGATTTSDGLLTLRAANGDELSGRYSGVPGELGVEEHITFTGGTGRFASATGSAVGVAKCDRIAGTCVFDVDGVIAYEASVVPSGS